MSTVDGAAGVLPSQHLIQALADGWIAGEVHEASIQPASVDLRLGEVAYRIRCSFLPDRDRRAQGQGLVIDEFDLRGEGAVLETQAAVPHPAEGAPGPPGHVRARPTPRAPPVGSTCSPGSSPTAARLRRDRRRLQGRLWLEVVPLSFTVRVHEGLSLNQLRLVPVTGPRSPTTSCEARHAEEPPAVPRPTSRWPAEDFRIADGLFLGLDLRGRRRRPGRLPGQPHTAAARHGRIGAYRAGTSGSRSSGRTATASCSRPGPSTCCCPTRPSSIPPDLAAEMTAYDPTAGELRTHYAGFFDPGFGYDPVRLLAGLTGRARGAGPRRAVHDRAPPAGLQAHLRAHARAPRPPLRHRASAPTTRARSRPSASTSSDPPASNASAERAGSPGSTRNNDTEADTRGRALGLLIGNAAITRFATVRDGEAPNRSRTRAGRRRQRRQAAVSGSTALRTTELPKTTTEREIRARVPPTAVGPSPRPRRCLVFGRSLARTDQAGSAPSSTSWSPG